MKTVVELKNINVYYGPIQALHDINIEIQEKDFLAVIGPNGGGKSTLLKVIAGLIQPLSGQVRVSGMPLHASPGKIGYVPQRFALNREFPISVSEVILTGRLSRNRLFLHHYSREDLEAVDRIMHKLDIHELRNRQIAQLSGGQLQRVLIARALVMKPEILLLDEPAASLDASSKTQIYSLLSEINREVTIIMVTHDMGVISSYVKNLACLNVTMFYHGLPELNDELLGKVYGCPVELIAHGVPHRVLPIHMEEHHHA